MSKDDLTLSAVWSVFLPALTWLREATERMWGRGTSVRIVVVLAALVVCGCTPAATPTPTTTPVPTATRTPEPTVTPSPTPGPTELANITATAVSKAATETAREEERNAKATERAVAREAARSATEQARLAVTYPVTVWCPECEMSPGEYLPLKLWSQAGGGGSSMGQVTHGENCTQTDRRVMSEYDVFVKLDCPGGSGWLREDGVRRR